MAEDEDIGKKFETVALSEIAASEYLALKKKQEGMSQMLVERLNPEALSIIKKSDPPLLTRLHYYYEMVEAIGKMDDKGFRFPLFQDSIETEVLILNRSKGGKIIDTFRSIAHITEGAPAQRRGLFGRH